MAYSDKCTQDAFMSKVDVRGDDECWRWQGTLSQWGHGKWRNKGAHRWAYEIFNGPIPRGLVVRHRCDNGWCCNPRHLEIGTHADNRSDCVTRQRHARGEAHGNAKLDLATIKAIRNERMTDRAISEKYGVSKATVKRVRYGEQWGGESIFGSQDFSALRKRFRSMSLTACFPTVKMVGDEGFEPPTSSM